MSKKRRPSPTEDDINRIAEALKNQDNFKKIKNKTSFDRAYDDYFGEENGEEFILNDKLRSKVWGRFFLEYPEDIEEYEEKRITKKGKQVKISKFTTEKGEVISVREKREFNRLGTVKGRIEYTEVTSVNINGKPQPRLRDKLGRFASPKRPQKR